MRKILRHSSWSELLGGYVKNPLKSRLFKKVLVPIVHGCEQTSAITAARSIAGEDHIVLMGLVYIPEEESLSSAAVYVQEVRQTLKGLSDVNHVHRWTEVYATHQPWDEIVKVTEKEKPDLLILEYPCQFESLKITPTEVLTHPPCDIAIVNSHISDDLHSALIPIRGGPYAELALRTALAIKRFRKIEVASLHMVPTDPAIAQDAAFRGIEHVLKNLPEVKKQSVATDNPAEMIFESSRQFDLIVMGASARPADEVTSIGPLAERIMRESQCGVIVVKT
ncbi:MAG: universal stress protein, partial [Chloroflexi bacterium]